MGLESAAAAIRSSSFQFTEGQAMGLSLELFCIASEERLHHFGEWGLDTVESVHIYMWLMTTCMFGPNNLFQIFSESSALIFLFSPLTHRVTNQHVLVISYKSLEQGISNLNV